MTGDFWQVYGRPGGLLILVGLALLPRLTLLFIGPWFTVVMWLGWFFWPQLLIAVLATAAYGKTNPFLVALAWVWVLAKLLLALTPSPDGKPT